MKEMQYFNPNSTFDNAIRNKEEGVLRALLIGIIGSDPTFETTEYEEANLYVKTQSEQMTGQTLNLSVEYKKQEEEYVKSKEEWNEEYYQMLLVWYRDNYADERLETIRSVGKEVYKNKQTLGKSKKQNRVAQKNSDTKGTVSNIQSRKKEAVVREDGNDVKNQRLNVREIGKKYWWLLAIIIGIGVICWWFFRE